MEKKLGTKYFIYGSLRKGMYNYDNFQLDKNTIEFGQYKLKGYKLYSLGSYPAVVRTGNMNDVVIGDVFRFTNPDVNTRIYRMEIGARYHIDEVTVKSIKTGKLMTVGVYAMAKEKLASHAVVVPSGDWVNKDKPVKVTKYKRKRSVVRSHKRAKPKKR